MQEVQHRFVASRRAAIAGIATWTVLARSTRLRADEVRPKRPPAAARTLRVPEDYATFARAYAAARAGDHITLANGTYAGAISLDRTFPGATPVVIRSRNPHGATFSGQITHSGAGHWLYEIRTTYNGATSDSDAAIKLTNGAFTLTRCRIDSPSGVYVAANPSTK